MYRIANPRVMLWCTGYRQACEAAKERLELLALNHSSDADTFRQDLLNIAKTTLRCRTASHANICTSCFITACVVTTQLRA